MSENVILIDENDAPIGLAEKLDAHRRGLLHRAFSIFAFNDAGELLLQQRAPTKYHSGGLWSNTCCGHPRDGETVVDAAQRRLPEELGIGFAEPREVGTLRYRADIVDLVENELDHIVVARADARPEPNPEEVAAWRYVPLDELESWLAERPDDFTAWFPGAWRVARSTR